MTNETHNSESPNGSDQARKLRKHDVSDNFVDFVEKADFLIGIPYGFQLGPGTDGRNGNLWFPPGCWGAPTIASIWTSLEPSYEQQRWLTSTENDKALGSDTISRSEHARRLSTHFFYRYGISTDNAEHEDALPGDDEAFAIDSVLHVHVTRLPDVKDHWVRVDTYEAISQLKEEESEDEPKNLDLILTEVSFMRPNAADATSILVLGDAMLFSGIGTPTGQALRQRAETAAGRYDWTNKQYLANVKSSVRNNVVNMMYGIRDRDSGNRVFTKKILRQMFLPKKDIATC